MILEEIKKDRFSAVYEKMENAFPYEEIRDRYDEKECLNNKSFHIFEIVNKGEYSGFAAVWFFNEFLFLEHLAVDRDKRSCGLGSKCVKEFIKRYNLPVILEAEAPVTEIQKKRIKFYKNLGFFVNDYEYAQPSYHGGESVPLKILSFPKPLSQEEFEVFYKKTRKSVYNCDI